MTTTKKTCFKCKVQKNQSDFYKHHAMADGYLGKCKACAKADSKKNRDENIEYVREYDRRRSSLPHRIEKAKQICKKWRKDFPNRSNAHNALSRAIKRGLIVPLPCMICGLKAEAHHPDYDSPLYVVWLCSAHHKQAHALVKAII